MNTLLARTTQPIVLLTLAQFAYITIGISYLSFEITWATVFVTVVTAVVSEMAFARCIDKKPLTSVVPLSAVTAALGICIFFRATNPGYFALAALIAIASKYFIRARGAHIFNPSNIAITSMVFFLPFAATIEFTQWGDNPLLFTAIALVNFGIAWRAGVWRTTLSFLVSYAVFLVPLLALFPDSISVHHYGLLSPSLTLFASFMITDPRTAPSDNRARIFHGMGVAALYFLLELLGVRYALFLASLLITVIFFCSKSVFDRGSLRTFAFPSLILVFALTAAMGLAYEKSGVRISPTAISPTFLLFGIDSTGFYRCSASPAYAPVGDSGIESGGISYGASWGDFNNDGYDDLFVANQSGTSSVLYRNMGDGTFADATREVGIPDLYASSALFVDIDNDGWRDLAVSAFEAKQGYLSVTVRVFKNAGGRYIEVTDSGLSSIEALGQGALSAGDYNNDGLLDLVLTSTGWFLNPSVEERRAFEKAWRDPFYVNNKTSRVKCGSSAVRQLIDASPDMFTRKDRDYVAETLLPMSANPCVFYSPALNLFPTGFPSYDGQPLATIMLVPGSVRMYENTGTSFREVSGVNELVERVLSRPIETSTRKNAPLDHVSGRFYQPVSFDYDGDGLLDVLIATDFGRSVLLKNRGSFQFTEEAVAAGLGDFGNGMGADVSDWNGDGKPDVVISNTGGTMLFENAGDGTFRNLTERVRMAMPYIGWGVAFVDYDGDGFDDVLQVNGVTIDSRIDRGTTRQALRIATAARNEGGTFADATSDVVCSSPSMNKALAVSDFNRDGAPDMFISSLDGGNSLWKHAGKTSYFSLDLVGSTSNRQGIGASVSLTIGTSTQTKFLLAGSSFASQQGSRLYFGTRGLSGPAGVRVVWPSGRVSEQSVLLESGSAMLSE